MQKPFFFINALRGLAAMAVVLFHALRANHIEGIPADFLNAIAIAETGVVIFFVISGFVIAHSMLKIDFGPSDVWRFILRRSIRLDPPYWAAIGLMLALSVVASIVVPGRPPAHQSVGQVVAHFFYAQEILGYMNLNPVFWTLCYEIQFYAVFALVVATRSPQLIMMVFAASLLWPLDIVPEVRGLFFNLFYTFLLGVGAAYAFHRAALRPWFVAYAGVVCFAAVHNHDLVALVSGVAGVLLLYVGVAGRLSAMNWRWLQFLGVISYSLYLTHNPVTGATFRVWAMIAGRSPEDQIVGLVLSFAACIVFAWIFFVVIEKPCIMLAKSAATKMPKVAPFGRLRVPAQASGATLP